MDERTPRGETWWPEPKGPARVIVPIVAQNPQAAGEQARAIAATDAELVEWRADALTTWSGDVAADALTAVAIVAHLREIVARPLIFTWRTADEGGFGGEKADRAYEALTGAVADARAADLVDVQACHPAFAALIERAHRSGVPVLGSRHDTRGTPPEEAIVAALAQIEDAGADVAKLAVMPATGSDVTTLLIATAHRAEVARKPIVTMAMGGKGFVSRVIGHVFGSQATFASVGPASAPGQPTLSALRGLWRMAAESGAIG